MNDLHSNIHFSASRCFLEAAIIKNCICTLCKLKEPSGLLGAPANCWYPRGFESRRPLAQDTSIVFVWKSGVLKVSWNHSIFSVWNFNQISILFNYVQLFNSSIYITCSSINLFSVQSHCSWAPEHNFINRMPLFHRAVCRTTQDGSLSETPLKLSCQIYGTMRSISYKWYESINETWKIDEDSSGIFLELNEYQWYLINYEYFSVLSELSRHSKVPAE